MIKWSVNPSSQSTWIASAGNKSVMLFSNSGSYQITANYYSDSSSMAPYDSSSSPVNVTDNIYSDSGTMHCNLIAQVPVYSNDQIVLVPVSYSDTGLVLLAHTQEIYDNHYPNLNYGTGTDSTVGFEFDFGTVTEYPCGNQTSTPTPATAILSFSSLNKGTQNLTIVLNGIIYRGSLTVTDTNCSFVWNYTSGVLLSPLSIQKQ